MTTFDPRLQEDFTLGPRSGFSSLKQGLFVATADDLDWTRLVHLLDECFLSVGGEGFAMYSPWFPKARQKQQAFRACLPQGEEYGLISTGFETFTAGFSERLLTLRARLGGDVSGLWTVGTCRGRAALEASLVRTEVYNYAPLALVTDLIDDVQAALCLDEMSESAVLLPVTESTASSVDRLKNQIIATVTSANNLRTP